MPVAKHRRAWYDLPRKAAEGISKHTGAQGMIPLEQRRRAVKLSAKRKYQVLMGNLRRKRAAPKKK